MNLRKDHYKIVCAVFGVCDIVRFFVLVAIHRIAHRFNYCTRPTPEREMVACFGVQINIKS